MEMHKKSGRMKQPFKTAMKRLLNKVVRAQEMQKTNK